MGLNYNRGYQYRRPNFSNCRRTKMSDVAKAWINRIGAIVAIVGVVGLSLAGGDVEAATTQGLEIAAVIGVGIVAVKELIQTIVNLIKK